MPSQRGEGQWALGYREPLNAAEMAKREDDGLNVRQRIESDYSRKGFASIWPSDLRNRFRWHGLYTQRPEGDGYFMLRVRIPGGALTSAQTETIGRISRDFGRDVADVTDRQNIQLHWIRIEDVPEIWRQLEGVGLSTTEACGDTPRNILGCPLAGVDASEVIDASPLVTATNARLVGDPEFSNLPRKYKISISGCSHGCAQHEINDVGLTGAIAPSRQRGFDLWVGGGLSTTPMFARRLGVFVAPEDVTTVVVAVTEIFRDWGYRRARNRARLKFLMRDWGPERFSEVLEERLGRRLPSLDEPPSSDQTGREHIGVWSQSDGLNYVGFAPRAGRIPGHALRAVAALAEEHGSGQVRTTTQQKMVILGVANEHVRPLVKALDLLDLPSGPSNWRAGTMACTGIEFCKLAIVETKGRAAEIYRYLERSLPGCEDEIRINVNGCPNSCARYQTADVGLMGCQMTLRTWVTDHEGNQVEERRKVEAFLVHLGGHLGRDRAFGRKVRGVKIPASEAGPYIESLIKRYRRQREDGETFARFVGRLDDPALAAFAAPSESSAPLPAPASVAEPRSSCRPRSAGAAPLPAPAIVAEPRSS